MPLTVDPEYMKVLEPMIPVLSQLPKPELYDAVGRRANFTTMFTSDAVPPLPDAPGVTETVHTIKSFDGATVTVRQYTPPQVAGSPSAAVVHYHGGGMILGWLPLFGKVCALLSLATGAQFFDVDYRVAPENPHPAPVEDCYAALAWVNENAAKLNVNPKRIAVQGESAGGGLAAGTALLARDRKLSPPLAKQILVYPMLDDRNVEPNPEISQISVWNHEDNITGWTALLGKGVPGTDKVSPYASPARVESVAGLPPTYIDLGNMDFFIKEDVEYATRLMNEKIPTELHVYPGVPHAFEAIAPGINVSQKAGENRIRAVLTI